MKQKQTLIFTFLSGVLCADLLLRTVFLFDAWNRGKLGGVLGFFVGKSGLWLTVSVLLCAAALAVGLFGKLLGKAGSACFIFALACGITEWSLFHLRILPGKAGVYHLLPRSLFRFVFRACGEKESTVKCFFEIRDTRITIEGFHKLVTATGLRIVNQRLYFINPNYQVKFGLKPRILSPVIGKIPYVRNFFTTTCYYLLAKQEEAN